MGYKCHKCDKCGKVFSAEANWKRHLVFHNQMQQLDAEITRLKEESK